MPKVFLAYHLADILIKQGDYFTRRLPFLFQRLHPFGLQHRITNELLCHRVTEPPGLKEIPRSFLGEVRLVRLGPVRVGYQ